MSNRRDGGGHWNRAARNGGGEKPFIVRGIGVGSREDAILYVQREKIRAEFGEEGVKKFDAMLAEKARREAGD